MKKIVLFLMMMLPMAVMGQEIRWSDKPGDKVSSPVEVFQVISPTKALVYGKLENFNFRMSSKKQLMLLYHDPDILLYDNQIYNVNKGELFRIAGTYTYMTRDTIRIYRTVPLIVIHKKKKKKSDDD